MLTEVLQTFCSDLKEMALPTLAGPSEAKLFQQLVEQQQQIIGPLTTQNKLQEKLLEKASIAEMRQCALAGEGTDASRMTRMWVTAQSATWSKAIKDTIIEMIYTDGNIKSIQYGGLFHDKDTRRGELLCVVFYKTYVEKCGRVYDAYTDSRRHDATAQMAQIRGGFCTCVPQVRGPHATSQCMKTMKTNQKLMKPINQRTTAMEK